jgi:hypothetical protein
MRSSNEEIYLSMGISKTVYDYGCTIEKSLRDRFDEVDSNAEYNQLKVVNAMQQHQVSEACLLGTTGYGYNDLGRDTWRLSMQRLSIRRMHWCALRSPAARMHWHWL